MKRLSRLSWSAGFTLVEALLATVLMAFLLGALATVTSQWLTNWDRGFARAQRAELLAAALERVLADLAAAEIISTGAGNDAPLSDGAERSVTFVRTALGPNASNGLEVIRMAETNDRRGSALVRMSAPFGPVSAGAPGTDQFKFSNPVVVVRAPYRVSFSYAGSDHIWRDTWRGAKQLPRAVRVSVRDAVTSRTLAMSTSTFIHAEVPARCTWPTTAECPGVAALSPRGPGAARITQSAGGGSAQAQ
jgi:general secretion pathway protein J